MISRVGLGKPMPFAALLYLFVRGLLPGGEDEGEEGGDFNEPGQGDNAAPELAVDPFLAALNAKNLRPSEYALKLAKGLVYTLLAARGGACYVEGRCSRIRALAFLAGAHPERSASPRRGACRPRD